VAWSFQGATVVPVPIPAPNRAAAARPGIVRDALAWRRFDDAPESLLRIASRPVSDIGRYADDVVAEAASDTDHDTCPVAVHVS
jgi:hypothetical protein